MSPSPWITPTRIAAAVVLVAVASLPNATEARSPGDEPNAQERQGQVRARQGEVALEVDALEAHDAEVSAALDTLAANVATQQAELDEAERAAGEAEEDLAEATTAVTDAQTRIDNLNAATDAFVVDAYVNPPSENAVAVLDASSISDVTLKQALLDIQSDGDADVLDQLAAAHEDLEVERQNRATVAAEAEAKRATAADELEQVEAAHAQQAEFAAEAEAALEHKLSEAAHLEDLDQELSAQIAAEQAALARQLETARQASGGSGGGGGSGGSGGGGGGGSVTVRDAPGGLATVGCPTGGSITVAGSLGGRLQGLLSAAGADGVGLCGWGYRDPDRQIALRRQNCGTSSYAIYQMPSSGCSPPTARPGFSMHEQGLAIDFTCNGGSISGRGNSCFQWLDRHASAHGLYNLPSEPWHWSTNGR